MTSHKDIEANNDDVDWRMPRFGGTMSYTIRRHGDMFYSDWPRSNPHLCIINLPKLVLPGRYYLYIKEFNVTYAQNVSLLKRIGLRMQDGYGTTITSPRQDLYNNTSRLMYSKTLFFRDIFMKICMMKNLGLGDKIVYKETCSRHETSPEGSEESKNFNIYELGYYKKINRVKAFSDIIII
jgi:hypothetical protein